MASFSTLQDYFNQNTLNINLWTQFTGGGATFTYAATGASVVYPASTTSSTDGDITSVNTYDLTGSYVFANITSIANAGTPTTVDNFLWVQDVGGTNKLTFLVEGGQLYAQKIVASVQTNLTNTTYSSTTHAWWRIRESGGTTYWETSPDGLEWTVFFSVANPITVTTLYVKIAGTAFSTATSPGIFSWRNFNTPPNHFKFNNSGLRPHPFSPGLAR